MTELRIPIGRYARRVFWTVVVSACLVLVVARFFLVPWLTNRDMPSAAEVADQSLGDILATVIAATVLSAVVIWLTRPAKHPTDLMVVHPKDISPRLEHHLAGAVAGGSAAPQGDGTARASSQSSVRRLGARTRLATSSFRSWTRARKTRAVRTVSIDGEFGPGVRRTGASQ
ncbi:MAG: hypothetical protein ACRDJC_23370, partial [Thermomicrobiales bacterium]